MAEVVVFTRTAPVAEVVERLVGAASESILVAQYRLTSPRLVHALEDARSRSARIRLLLDQNKYADSPVTRELIAKRPFPVRVLFGRKGEGSKMHHKFAILDARIVLAGSFNWTRESEEDNYENLVILREPQVVESYAKEFEELWIEGTEL